MPDHTLVAGSPPEARLAFETLIADTSAALISATAESTDAVVDAGLERLRVFFDVDRVGLLRVCRRSCLGHHHPRGIRP